ncbi:MAG TPA: RNA methyltransferase substrate-binding domain-containing protein, partial [Geminicoccaceae bacterium]|nr:RNA methyltransferase substrate-binding domain-containing protein [Geminicoccaceae bacterium]
MRDGGGRRRRERAAEPERGRGRGRDHRGERDPALWLYGRHAVEAALANPRRTCHRLLATRDALARLGDAAARRPGLAVETVDRAAIERTLGGGGDAVHQGLALHVAPLPPHRLERACAP